jgi:hypothetical protein
MDHRLSIVALIALTGCAAMPPDQMAQKSHWDVCRFTMGGPHSQVAEGERQRRGLDCGPYYPAIQQQQANQNAATQTFINSLQRPAAAPVRNCQSIRTSANTVETRCY